MRRDNGYILPTVIEPPDTICIRIEVPNDDNHIRAFWGAMDTLGQFWNWERDPSKQGTLAAQVWRDTVNDARLTWGNCDMSAVTDIRIVGCNLEALIDEVWTVVADLSTCITTHTDPIQSQVDDNEAGIGENTDDIEDIEANPADGNTYEEPAHDPQTDVSCQISGHLASKIGDYIAQIDTYASEPTFFDAMESALSGSFNYAVSELATAIDNFFTGGQPALFSDYQSQQADVHEELYCSNDFSKDALATWAVSNLTRGQEISDMLNSIALTTWEQWQALGQYASGYDCSSFGCGTWCYRFDFTQGLDGWTIDYGTQTAQGLETGHRNFDGGTYHDIQAYLDLTGISATQMRVVGTFVDVYLNNSSIVWWGRALGSGTNQIFEDHNAGWSTQNAPRDSVVDISDWTDIAMFMRAACKVSGQYTGTPEAYIEFIELSGTGANPFGSDNCS